MQFPWTSRVLVEDFSRISRPMTQLLKKDRKFEWSEACEASFQELKRRLTTGPVLVLQIFNKILTFIVMFLIKVWDACLCNKGKL